MRTIFVSNSISEITKKMLNHLGVVIEIQPHSVVYDSINQHPDIFLFCSKNKIYFSKEQYELIEHILSQYPLPIEVLESQLGDFYPRTISFNGLIVGKYFFHNLKYTAPPIINEMKSNGRELIHVKQGYTRCSVLPIDEQSIITSDLGIAKTASKHRIEVCLIRTGSILLHGQPYGFIGGTGGRVGGCIYFSGNIAKHPDYNKIRQFIESKGLEIKCDPLTPLMDVGSILTYEKE